MSENVKWNRLARQLAMLERLLDLADEQTETIADTCGALSHDDEDPLDAPAFHAAMRHLTDRAERMAGRVSTVHKTFFRPW